MEEMNSIDIHSQPLDVNEDSDDPKDSTSFNEDSAYIYDENSKLKNDNNIELENEEQFTTEEHEIELQSGPDSKLESEAYPDLVDELSGIIYLSRIPPFMGLSKLRSYFSKFGKIGKIYAHPEPIGQYRKRVKMGGNKRLKFTHAWIQFYDKIVAKNVAKLLNNQPFSDTKRSSFWKYDIWNIKYLPKFKWHHLVEYWSEHKRESKEQLNLLLQRERKKNLRYLEQLEIEKREHHMELKKKRKVSPNSGASDSAGNDVSVAPDSNITKVTKPTVDPSTTTDKAKGTITHSNDKINTNTTLSKKFTHNKKRKKIKDTRTSDKEIPLNLLNSIAL